MLLPHHQETFENPFTKALEDLSWSGLITAAEYDDLLTQQPRSFREEHS